MAKGRKGKKGNMSREQQQAMHASMRSRGVRMGKTPQGMDADLSESANVLPDTPANRRKWEKPGGSRRMDLEGIDTKPKIVMQVTFEDVTPDIPKDWTDITQEEHDRFIIKIEDELSSTLLSGRKQKFTDKELSEWAKERGYTGAMVDTAYRNKTRSVDDIEREIKKVESQLESLHFGATSRAQATTRSARSGNLAKRLDSLKDELRERKGSEASDATEFAQNAKRLVRTEFDEVGIVELKETHKQLLKMRRDMDVVISGKQYKYNRMAIEKAVRDSDSEIMKRRKEIENKSEWDNLTRQNIETNMKSIKTHKEEIESIKKDISRDTIALEILEKRVNRNGKYYEDIELIDGKPIAIKKETTEYIKMKYYKEEIKDDKKRIANLNGYIKNRNDEISDMRKSMR